MIDTKNGFGEYKYNGTDLYNAYHVIDGTSWILVSTAVQSEALSRLNQLITMLLICMAVIAVLSLAAAYGMGKILAAPIVRLTGVMNKRAALDFTQDTSATRQAAKRKRKDEIDQMCLAAETMAANVREFIIGVADTAEQVSATSQELSATSQQSASVSEEIAQSVDKIAMGADDQANSTEKASDTVGHLNHEIETNLEVSGELFHATEKINTSVDKGNQTIAILSEKNAQNSQATQVVYNSVLKTRESTARISEATGMIS